MPSFRFRSDDSGVEYNVVMPQTEYDAIMASGGKRKQKSGITGKTVTSTAVDMTYRVGSPLLGVGTYPFRSDALGVAPEQAAEFNAAARASGNTGVFYCPQTGDCIISSRSGRRMEARRRGMLDRNGGYSDP